jgi:hypothetical protein
LGDAVVVGVGATATMDVAAEIVRRTTGVAPLDYRYLTRWISTRWRPGSYDTVAAAPPVPAERPLGVVAHYLVGVGFAGLLLAARPTWIARPTPGPAVAVGLATTIAPFLLLQPALGLGVAASKAPDPTVARLRTIRTHATYGVGLYLSGRALAAVRSRRR